MDISSFPTLLSASEWQSAKDVAACTSCHCSFTLFTRQHHCRHCGLVVCSKCSSKTLSLWPPDSFSLLPNSSCSFSWSAERGWKEDPKAMMTGIEDRMHSTPQRESLLSLASAGRPAEGWDGSREAWPPCVSSFLQSFSLMENDAPPSSETDTLSLSIPMREVTLYPEQSATPPSPPPSSADPTPHHSRRRGRRKCASAPLPSLKRKQESCTEWAGQGKEGKKDDRSTGVKGGPKGGDSDAMQGRPKTAGIPTHEKEKDRPCSAPLPPSAKTRSAAVSTLETSREKPPAPPFLSSFVFPFSFSFSSSSSLSGDAGEDNTRSGCGAGETSATDERSAIEHPCESGPLRQSHQDAIGEAQDQRMEAARRERPSASPTRHRWSTSLLWSPFRGRLASFLPIRPSLIRKRTSHSTELGKPYRVCDKCFHHLVVSSPILSFSQLSPLASPTSGAAIESTTPRTEEAKKGKNGTITVQLANTSSLSISPRPAWHRRSTESGIEGWPGEGSIPSLEMVSAQYTEAVHLSSLEAPETVACEGKELGEWIKGSGGCFPHSLGHRRTVSVGGSTPWPVRSPDTPGRPHSCPPRAMARCGVQAATGLPLSSSPPHSEGHLSAASGREANASLPSPSVCLLTAGDYPLGTAKAAYEPSPIETIFSSSLSHSSCGFSCAETTSSPSTAFPPPEAKTTVLAQDGLPSTLLLFPPERSGVEEEEVEVEVEVCMTPPSLSHGAPVEKAPAARVGTAGEAATPTTTTKGVTPLPTPTLSTPFFSISPTPVEGTPLLPVPSLPSPAWPPATTPGVTDPFSHAFPKRPPTLSSVQSSREKGEPPLPPPSSPCWVRMAPERLAKYARHETAISVFVLDERRHVPRTPTPPPLRPHDEDSRHSQRTTTTTTAEVFSRLPSTSPWWDTTMTSSPTSSTFIASCGEAVRSSVSPFSQPSYTHADPHGGEEGDTSQRGGPQWLRSLSRDAIVGYLLHRFSGHPPPSPPSSAPFASSAPSFAAAASVPGTAGVFPFSAHSSPQRTSQRPPPRPANNAPSRTTPVSSRNAEPIALNASLSSSASTFPLPPCPMSSRMDESASGPSCSAPSPLRYEPPPSTTTVLSSPSSFASFPSPVWAPPSWTRLWPSSQLPMVQQVEVTIPLATQTPRSHAPPPPSTDRAFPHEAVPHGGGGGGGGGHHHHHHARGPPAISTIAFPVRLSVHTAMAHRKPHHHPSHPTPSRHASSATGGHRPETTTPKGMQESAAAAAAYAQLAGAATLPVALPSPPLFRSLHSPRGGGAVAASLVSSSGVSNRSSVRPRNPLEWQMGMGRKEGVGLVDPLRGPGYPNGLGMRPQGGGGGGGAPPCLWSTSLPTDTPPPRGCVVVVLRSVPAAFCPPSAPSPSSTTSPLVGSSPVPSPLPWRSTPLSHTASLPSLSTSSSASSFLLPPSFLPPRSAPAPHAFPSPVRSRSAMRGSSHSVPPFFSCRRAGEEVPSGGGGLLECERSDLPPAPLPSPLSPRTPKVSFAVHHTRTDTISTRDGSGVADGVQMERKSSFLPTRKETPKITLFSTPTSPPCRSFSLPLTAGVRSSSNSGSKRQSTGFASLFPIPPTSLPSASASLSSHPHRSSSFSGRRFQRWMDQLFKTYGEVPFVSVMDIALEEEGPLCGTQASRTGSGSRSSSVAMRGEKPSESAEHTAAEGRVVHEGGIPPSSARKRPPHPMWWSKDSGLFHSARQEQLASLTSTLEEMNSLEAMVQYYGLRYTRHGLPMESPASFLFSSHSPAKPSFAPLFTAEDLFQELNEHLQGVLSNVIECDESRRQNEVMIGSGLVL